MEKKNVVPDDLDLNLPDAPDFVSHPPLFSLKEMIQICEKMLPYWNEKRFNDQQQHLQIITEPFSLD